MPARARIGGRRSHYANPGGSSGYNQPAARETLSPQPHPTPRPFLRAMQTPDDKPDAFAAASPVIPDPPVAGDPPIAEGRRVAAGRGGSWISEGWRMFKEAPGSWVACFLIFVVLMIVLAIIPILGNILGALLSPFLVAGMMAGCRELERN